jgi:hypothetical protein
MILVRSMVFLFSAQFSGVTAVVVLAVLPEAVSLAVLPEAVSFASAPKTAGLGSGRTAHPGVGFPAPGMDSIGVLSGTIWMACTGHWSKQVAQPVHLS